MRPVDASGRAKAAPIRQAMTRVTGDYDEERTKALEAAGVHVLRFGNREVLDELDEVLTRIGAELRLPFD